MPAIFLGSAIISGIAILIVLYVVVSKIRRDSIDGTCMKGLAYMLWGFLIFAVVLEFLEYINLVYKGREGIETVMHLVNGPLWFSVWILQVGLGSVVPFAILTYLIARNTQGKHLVIGLTVSAVLVLTAVLAMRWNVVIGGQDLSKTMMGLITYQPPFWGQEGLLTAATVFALPLGMLWVLTRVLPPWENDQRA
jgi:formate-dependent nitrite reductase membrane component NrfD